MDGVATQNRVDPNDVCVVNELLTQRVIQKAVDVGVRTFCVCAGKRSCLLIWAVKDQEWLEVHDWVDERSAAFFALGKARAKREPVAIITTSGTAVGELLPATMEAYYTSVPLLLLTADRPKGFRGSGAPQSAEQKGIFGVYAPFSEDLEGDDESFLDQWNQCAPAHVNVCMEEPTTPKQPFQIRKPSQGVSRIVLDEDFSDLREWLQSTNAPFVVVGALPPEARDPVCRFLQGLQAPVYLEGLSGLREEPALQDLRIQQVDQLTAKAEQSGYPIDGMLRIGGVPTHRFWRDMEEWKETLSVFSVSPYPFSGLSGEGVLCLQSEGAWKELPSLTCPSNASFATWKKRDQQETEQLREKPLSELDWMQWVSEQIPAGSLVYLGNSLPIREWDRVATSDPKQLEVVGNRGVNGIDGQLSTFFGMCTPERENWGIFGDLTALYDFSAYWALQKMANCRIRVVILNNGGGKIFQMLKRGEELMNRHSFDFSSIADFWHIPYLRLGRKPEEFVLQQRQMIEIIPT